MTPPQRDRPADSLKRLTAVRRDSSPEARAKSWARRSRRIQSASCLARRACRTRLESTNPKLSSSGSGISTSPTRPRIRGCVIWTASRSSILGHPGAYFFRPRSSVTGSEPNGQLKSLTRSVRWELVDLRLTRAAFKRKGDDAEVIFSDCFY
jgi:hypothetical protein